MPKKIIPVPFYSNTSDDSHCFQAGIKMVLKYFEPNKNFSWKKLDKLSAKKLGLWTWPTAMILNLYKMGYQVELWEDWDYQAFVDKGADYLYEKYGNKVGKEQVKNSDLRQERDLMQKFLTLGKWKHSIPSQKDIKRFIDKGYLVCCNINSKKLNNKPGFAGHFIVVIGYDNKSLIIRDPGLPPLKKRKISTKSFESAWAYPSKDIKNIMAIKIAN